MTLLIPLLLRLTTLFERGAPVEEGDAEDQVHSEEIRPTTSEKE